MSRRWIVAALLLFGISLLLFLPLAVAMQPLAAAGFSARQIGGTIWGGRIGELHLAHQRLGSFEARLDPWSLLRGDPALALARFGAVDAPLRLRLHGGRERGIGAATGSVTLPEAMAGLPLGALHLDEVALGWRDGRCVRASGRVRSALTLPVAIGDPNFAGGLSCTRNGVRFALRNRDGWPLTIDVDGDRRWRASLRVSGVAPDMLAALAAAGFREAPGGADYRTSGRW